MSSQPSSLGTGESTYLYYRCDANFQVCFHATRIYNAVIMKSNIENRLLDRGKDWRDAMSRYNHYIDFVADNNLKEKLLALADEELNLPKAPEHLYP